MGKGVGPVKSYILNVKAGVILLELQALISKELFFLLRKLKLKLPVKTTVLFKSYY